MNDQLLKIKEGLKTGLLCNHTSWDIQSGRYLFEKIPGLKRIFLPEHGLFAELQDQTPMVDTDIYSDFGIDAELVSLYGKEESSLRVGPNHLDGLDLLIIDLQDVGSRYFTYAVTMSYMLEAVETLKPDMEVLIIDRENPAGLQVEGSRLPVEYESFIGRTGLPHRHGLTIAELALFFHKRINASFSLSVVPLSGQKLKPELPRQVTIKTEDFFNITHLEPWAIPPSPNIPGQITPLVYSGQCIVEGTNLSEGRGTTRPFEIFGAPWLKARKMMMQERQFLNWSGAKLRPLRFVPTFHKWAGEVCEGFQIHLTGDPYHSLVHSLFLIRTIREHFIKFEWLDGPYEMGSDKTAIELICGDPVLIGYLNGQYEFTVVKDYLTESEQKWLLEMEMFKLYDRKNYSVLNLK